MILRIIFVVYLVFLGPVWSIRMVDDVSMPLDRDFKLFAYGDGGIDGMRVFAADGRQLIS